MWMFRFLSIKHMFSNRKEPCVLNINTKNGRPLRFLKPQVRDMYGWKIWAFRLFFSTEFAFEEIALACHAICLFIVVKKWDFPAINKKSYQKSSLYFLVIWVIVNYEGALPVVLYFRTQYFLNFEISLLFLKTVQVFIYPFLKVFF